MSTTSVPGQSDDTPPKACVEIKRSCKPKKKAPKGLSVPSGSPTPRDEDSIDEVRKMVLPNRPATKKVVTRKALRRRKVPQQMGEAEALVSTRPRAQTCDDILGQQSDLTELVNARPRAMTCEERCPWGHPLYATELRGWLCDECGIMEPSGFRLECAECSYCLCCACVHTLKNAGLDSLRENIAHKRSPPQSPHMPLALESGIHSNHDTWTEDEPPELPEEKPLVPRMDKGSPRTLASAEVQNDAVVQDCIDIQDALQQKPQLLETSVDINGEGCVEYIFQGARTFSFSMGDHLKQTPRVAVANVKKEHGGGCPHWFSPKW